MDIDESLMNTGEDGLSSSEAHSRLERYGRNELEEKVKPKWKIFLGHVRSHNPQIFLAPLISSPPTTTPVISHLSLVACHPSRATMFSIPALRHPLRLIFKFYTTSTAVHWSHALHDLDCHPY